MRKVIVSMNVTMDGFMAASDDGLDWHFRFWSDEMAEESAMQLSRADTIVLGRKTYEAMAAYWPIQAANPGFPRQDIAFAEMMNGYSKIVFSTTLCDPSWNNSRVLASGLENEVRRLKTLAGKHIFIYGSGSILLPLMRCGLIDEYQIWMHPIRIGNGSSFLPSFKDMTGIQLFDQKKFACGVVLLFYKAMVPGQ